MWAPPTSNYHSGSAVFVVAVVGVFMEQFWNYIKDRPFPDPLARRGAGFTLSARPDALGVVRDPQGLTDAYYVQDPYKYGIYGYSTRSGYNPTKDPDYKSLVSEYGEEPFVGGIKRPMIAVFNERDSDDPEMQNQFNRSTLMHEGRHRALKDFDTGGFGNFDKNVKTEEDVVRLYDWLYGDYSTRQDAKNYFKEFFNTTPEAVLANPAVRQKLVDLQKKSGGSNLYKLPLYSHDETYDLPVGVESLRGSTPK